MIQLTSTTAIMLYLCMTLLALLSVWCCNHFFSRKKKIVLAEQELFVCEYCHFAYLADLMKTVTQCPQCRSYNKKT